MDAATPWLRNGCGPGEKGPLGLEAPPRPRSLGWRPPPSLAGPSPSRMSWAPLRCGVRPGRRPCSLRQLFGCYSTRVPSRILC
eukprot:15431984-Alexandrium_andersonii.AAC.1